MLTVRAMCLPPPMKKRVLRIRIKHAVKQAMLICPNFEDTIQCKLAWDLVDELSKADNKPEPEKKDEMCDIDPRACKEYDV